MTTTTHSLTGGLRAFLDGSRAGARDRIREEILSHDDFAPVTTDISDADYRERVLAQLRTLASKDGGTGVGFPTQVGGDNDIGAYVTAFETLAMGDLSLLVKAGVQFGLFGGAVQHLGTQAHHEEYLPGVISCQVIGGFAMTETGHGSNVQQIGTTATYDPHTSEFVINTPDRASWKDYIGNAAAHGTVVVVFAQLVTNGEGHGVHGFIVPIRDAVSGEPPDGVKITDDGHKAGLNGVDNGRLAFDHMRIPRANLLDRFASVADDGTYTSPIDSDTKRFFTTIGTLVQGRISVGGGAIGATKRALTIAVRYAEQRRQFGPPDSEVEVVIMDYLAHQRRLLPALATTYALQIAQTRNVDDLHKSFSEGKGDEEFTRRLESRAAGLKALATWHATSTIQTCREACGGAGYLAENLLPQIKADTDVFTTFEGDNTVLLQLVAKELLTGFQTEVGSLDTIGTARFFAEIVSDLVAEKTSARRVAQAVLDTVTRREDDEQWSAADLVELLGFREEHLLSGLARRLRGGVESEGRNPFEVFNECQDHVVALARAHVEVFVMRAFAEEVATVQEGQSRQVLDLLVELHGLSTIQSDRAWFMEHGRLSATRSKGVTARVNDLCRELRPHAGTLVDAFGVPDLQVAAAMLSE